MEMLSIEKFCNMAQAVYGECLLTQRRRAVLAGTTSLLAMTLAAPAADATERPSGLPPIPHLISAVNMAWGTQGGNGEEVALAVDPTTGNVFATDFDGHISLITHSPAGRVRPNANLNPDLAAVYAADPTACSSGP
jgi:hypothetical protein